MNHLRCGISLRVLSRFTCLSDRNVVGRIPEATTTDLMFDEIERGGDRLGEKPERAMAMTVSVSSLCPGKGPTRGAGADTQGNLHHRDRQSGNDRTLEPFARVEQL